MAFAASTLAASGAEAITYDGTYFAPRGDGPYTVGNLILIGDTALTVSALGVQDLNAGGTGAPTADGFFEVSSAGIWTADGGTLLAAISIWPHELNTTVINSYRYKNLESEITLEANTLYLIGAIVGAGIEFWLDAGTVEGATSPYGSTADLSIKASYFTSDFGDFVPPTSVAGQEGGLIRWAPTNFQYTLVP